MYHAPSLVWREKFPIYSNMDARTEAADYDESSSSSSSSSCYVGGAIVVVARCPLAGTCKTRLIPLLGEEGAACLARAMLSDVLLSISECVSILL